MLGRAVQNSEDFVLAHNHQFLAVDGDFAARILAEQDAVAGLHVGRDNFAVFHTLAFSNSDDFALLRLFFRRIGDKQSADFGLLLFNAFHNDTVMERSNIHRLNLLQASWLLSLQSANEVASAEEYISRLRRRVTSGVRKRLKMLSYLK